jgi:hypothetical protein
MQNSSHLINGLLVMWESRESQLRISGLHGTWPRLATLFSRYCSWRLRNGTVKDERLHNALVAEKGNAQQRGCRTGEVKADSGSLRARWGEVESKRKSKQLYAHLIIRRKVYDLRFLGAGPLHSHLLRFKLNLMLLGFADDGAA